MTINKTVLKDCLYNLNLDSTATYEYCRGIIIGMVSGLMCQGMTYMQAIELVANNLPDSIDPNMLPEAYRSDIQKIYLA